MIGSRNLSTDVLVRDWPLDQTTTLPFTATFRNRQLGPSVMVHTAARIRASWLSWCWLLAVPMAHAEDPSANGPSPVTLNEIDDGYRGIWYMNQPSGDEFMYKYSGGLGTYCAKHQPFAVYCADVDRTFFCFGGTTRDRNDHLVHMVSYFDHHLQTVARPTRLLDKQTSDAHDNPVISVDDDGYVWVFSTSHGTSRPSYIHRSVRPYEVDSFQQVDAVHAEGEEEIAIDNFSYMQAWHVRRRGFICFFTRYGDPAPRTIMCMTSRNGVHWTRWQRLAAIEEGHYQISAVGRDRAGTAFNYHPRGKGLNWRTNLYYLQTADFGKSWQTVDGDAVNLPLTDPHNPALVRDYRQEGLNVYLKDICFDAQGHPVILYLTSAGYAAGPMNDPRRWMTAQWNGSEWRIRPAFTSDNNYDMGSLWIEAEGTWRIIAPTATGPQPYNPGGEVVMWVSRNRGEQWQRARQLTHDSKFNHTYVRRPVNAHPGFYAFWADGHGRQPSSSRLYTCDRRGDVWMLPTQMTQDHETLRRLRP